MQFSGTETGLGEACQTPHSREVVAGEAQVQGHPGLLKELEAILEYIRIAVWTEGRREKGRGEGGREGRGKKKGREERGQRREGGGGEQKRLGCRHLIQADNSDSLGNLKPERED